MSRIAFHFALMLTITLAAQTAHAQTQTDEHRFEVGGQLTIINLQPLESIFTLPNATVRASQFGQGAFGFGGRVGYNFNEYVALETAGSYFPEKNFSEVDLNRKAQFFAGVKAGKRAEKFGVFAKARPGVMYFSELGNHTRCDLAAYPQLVCTELSQTNFAFDIGGVVEYYPTPRAIVRFDAGDTIVRFKEAGPTLLPGNGSVFTPAATTHNFQASVGFGFRF